MSYKCLYAHLFPSLHYSPITKFSWLGKIVKAELSKRFFSNLTMHSNHLGIELKYTCRFYSAGIQPETLHV